MDRDMRKIVDGLDGKAAECAALTPDAHIRTGIACSRRRRARMICRRRRRRRPTRK